MRTQMGEVLESMGPLPGAWDGGSRWENGARACVGNGARVGTACSHA